MPNPDFTENIVKEILEDLTFKEKSIIEYMDENNVSILEAILERYVEGKGSRIRDGKHTIKRIWAELI